MALQGVDPQVAAVVREAQEKVRRSPQSGGAWGLLGMILYAHNFQAQALVCFNEAQRLDRREPRWPYFRGLCLLQQDPDPRRAIPALKQAAALTGETLDTPRLLLAETLLSQGRPKEAEPLLRQVLRHDPKNARALLGLGRLALSRGQLNEAHDVLMQSYRSAPRVKATQLLLAQAFQRHGDVRTAAAIVRRTAKLPDQAIWPDPFAAEAYRLRVGKVAQMQRGEELLITGQFHSGVRWMQKVTQQYPNAARAWMLLGAAYTGDGKPAQGEKMLRKSLALDPKSAECYNHLGDAVARQNRNREAAQWFRKALAFNPRSAEFHFNLGVCLFRLGDMTGASKEFSTTLRLDPNTIKGRAGLAEVLARQHQTKEAIQQLQDALSLNPRDPILEKSLARLRGSNPSHQKSAQS